MHEPIYSLYCPPAGGGVWAAGSWSYGLIKVQTPVSKMYSGSSSVVLGKVSKVNAETGVIEAAATTLKGDGVGEAIKVKVDNLPEVVKGVKEGSPLVLLIGRRSASGRQPGRRVGISRAGAEFQVELHRAGGSWI